MEYSQLVSRIFSINTGQIIADLGPQKVAFRKGNGTPYFTIFQVGEIYIKIWPEINSIPGDPKTIN